MPAPYPRALRGRIAALNRLPRHDARDPIARDVVRQRAADACEYCLLPNYIAFRVYHTPHVCAVDSIFVLSSHACISRYFAVQPIAAHDL